MPDDIPPEDGDPTATAGAAPSPEVHFPPGYESLEVTYKPVAEIGKGGMGVVFRALEVALKRHVAIKFLLANYDSADPEAWRFREEAGITAQLQHPNIPPVYSVGMAPSGRPYLVMKFVRGKTLHDLLPPPGASKEERAVQRGRWTGVFEGIAQAVGYAHARKVIHRDLKPRNVMVGAFGEVQVMDWGLAKVIGFVSPPEPEHEADERATVIIPPLDAHERATLARGTPAYMPPEQARGESDKVDCRADVFALGAILCRILTGAAPYTGRDDREVLSKAARWDTDAVLARLDACGADSELIELAKWCLARDPKDRPTDAGAVALAVAKWRTASEARARDAAVADAARERVRGLYVHALGGFDRLMLDLQSRLSGATLGALRESVLLVARGGFERLFEEVRHGPPDRTLLWTYLQRGRLDLALRRDADAVAEYRHAESLARQLVLSNGESESWWDLSICLDYIGDALLGRGDLEGAQTAYTESHEIRLRLTTDSVQRGGDDFAHPALGASHEKLGDVALRQRKMDAALGYYRKAHEFAERLSGAMPNDVQVQRDYGRSFRKLGEAAYQTIEHVALVEDWGVAEWRDSHSARAALENYQKSSAVLDALALRVPNDAQVRADRVASYERCDELLVNMGRADEGFQLRAAAAALRREGIGEERAVPLARAPEDIAPEDSRGAWLALSRAPEAIRNLGRYLEHDSARREVGAGGVSG